MSPTETLSVELSSVEIQPNGGSFVLSLVDANSGLHRMELPSWALHQLMRMLPRLDAALLQAQREVTSDLIAYPVTQWDLERVATDQSVALSVLTDRGAESAFLFGPEDALALHTTLGETLAEAFRGRARS